VAQPEPRAANFDRIARLYRWLEYASFGPVLQSCRTEFLQELTRSRKALVFGDGDGRFLSRLLAANPGLHARAVDSSAAMLRLLEKRAAHAGASARLTATRADAVRFTPCDSGYDLVATHFFLDCLTNAEVSALLHRVRPALAPGALWVVSEFATPGPSSALLVRGLYFAFRWLTGLRVTHLPDHATIMLQQGFTLVARKQRLRGLLVAELWQATGDQVQSSH
jgi:ubiquinone/menaquinone biosynthesis C-methylase UbiE